ncbi:MAG: hypothetical protein ACC707_04490 [Thiohalomonadales bacterium]
MAKKNKKLVKSKDRNSSESAPKESSAALQEKWIVPIRIIAYLVLAASSAYIYWNAHDLEIMHYMIFLTIAAACAMALLDCRMSAEHWEKKRINAKKKKWENNN